MNIYISLLITMAFSAFFSGMEIAFVSVDKLRFEMERKGGITSRILSIFFKNSNEFISTMLVGNNIALVIYGILMAQIIGDNLLAGFIDNHFLMVLAQTVISTLIILVTGEFLPKTLFKINPNLVLNVAAIPLFICYVILYPVSKLSSGLSCLFLRIFGMKVNKDASDKAFGKVDLDYFVQSSIDNAANEEELDTEVKIFQNALDFSNIKIRDCIVPRTEVVAVDLTTSLDELKSRFIESGISKIIVYDGNIDNVVGFIHSSEMFRDPKDWRDNVKDVGWPEGHLSLEASYGPVIWSSSLFVADHQENAHSLYRRPEILRDLPGLTRSAAPLSWRDCCETVGPEGVSWLLHQLRSHLAGEHPPAACQSVHQIALSRLWQQILRKTGNAEIRRLTPPHHDRLAGFYNDDDKEAL